MQIPTTLKHKPIITVPDYAQIDGRTAEPAQGQSLSQPSGTTGKGRHLGQDLAAHRENGRARAKKYRYTG